ncbi:ribosomal protein P0 (A0) (L10E) [Tulasnella sp. 417]|nr:ribosomal protein P0 (A0) (L10E) [Tulasnella sp. 417]
MGVVKKNKEAYFQKLKLLLETYPSIFIVNVDNVGSNQMHQIRVALRGTGVVLMGKNTMVRRALRVLLSELPQFERLMPHVRGNVGFVFTSGDLKDVRTLITSNTVAAPARAGALAPVDVTVPAGNTGMEPGKTSFFQALGIPTKIARGTIEIISDVKVVHAGSRVGPSEATLLNMMNISPFTYAIANSRHPSGQATYVPSTKRSIVVVLGLGLFAIDAATAQLAPSSRWGQASTVAGTTLLVQGGKVDPSNSYSYTAAPNTNDLFALDLSQPFDCTDPPWAYLSGSQDPASSQGPAIAFHTLSAYSQKRALSFGGEGGPNMAIETNADSVWTLEFWNQSSVSWTQQEENWGDQPIRRIYHSAAVYDKAVWITGGERADGSGLGFAETFLFTGSGSSGQFINLQAAVAGGVLSDIVGHRTVVLPNGLLVAIGGFSPSHQSMIPMTTIFTLDTMVDTAVWGLMVAQGRDIDIPEPRRNFALAVLPNNTLLIHGGSDMAMQTFYSDGFTLNFNTNPPTWTALSSELSDSIGPRIDHMAVGVGKNVIFGFGRSPNGPAPETLVVYDSTTDIASDTYEPDSSGSTNPNTTPTATNGHPTATHNPSDGTSPSVSVSDSSPRARKDMLGDEDDTEFFVPGHVGGPSGGSTSSAVRPTFKRWGSSTRQLWTGMVNASTTSFKAAFGFGGNTDGPPTPASALFNRGESPDWWEKTKDPFSDEALLMANLPTSPTALGMGLAASQRQREGGGGHYQSATWSSTSTGPYRDPFVDSSLPGHSRESTAASLSGPYVQMARAESYQPFMMPLDDPPPPSSLVSPRSLSPPTIDMSNVRLAPGIITPGTLASSDTLGHPHEFGLTTPSTETNTSSNGRSTSPYGSLLTTPPTSIIGSAPTTPMKRSDSWWTRFGRASLTSLNRSGSGAGGLNPIRKLSLRGQMGSRSPTDVYAALDFRDPNPPPRLEGIEETGQSNDPSPESVKARQGSGDNALPAIARLKQKHPLRDLHSKSLSSMATADSEALEKIGGRMDVIQRGRTASSETSTPAGSINEDWEYGIAHLVPLQHASPVSSVGSRPSMPMQKSSSGTSGAMPTPPSASGSGTQETYITAPTHQTHGPQPRQESSDSVPSIPPPPAAPRRGRRPSAGLATRVAVFENMALTTSPPGSPLSPTFSRSPSTAGPSPLGGVDKRKSAGVRYGLMERPPLFVANPDAKREGTESTMEGEILTPPPPSASSPRPLL